MVHRAIKSFPLKEYYVGLRWARMVHRAIKTFPLKECYVGLRWARVVHRAIKTFKQELSNIYDILTIAEPSEEAKATNILVEGEKYFLCIS